MKKFQTIVREIGNNVSMFSKEHMIILFGDEAPYELREFCFIIDINKVEKEIKKGDILILDGREYKIIEVGSQVNKNLNELGHITINFKKKDDEMLPGTLYVNTKEVVNLNKGSIIEIKEDK